MSFKWKSSNESNNKSVDNRLCPISPDTSNETKEIVILALEMHNIPAVGCCGQSRSDIIYGIGYDTSIHEFKKEALAIAKKYEQEKDIFSLEYFEGVSAQDERGKGMSIFKLSYDNDKWCLYEKGVLLLSANNYEELLKIW